MNRESCPVFIAFFLVSCTASLPEPPCLIEGEECPDIDRERVHAVTCQCVCSTPLDGVIGQIEGEVTTCLPDDLNASLANSEELEELLEFEDAEYYERVNAWCTVEVAGQLTNIASGVAHACGSISCACVADMVTLVEEERCTSQCIFVRCTERNCPRSVLDRETYEVNVERCRCTESNFCDAETTGVICRPTSR